MLAMSAISLFGLSSCLQVESTIAINKDGSGTITEITMLGDQMKTMIEAAAAQGGAEGQDPMAEMVTKAKAEADKRAKSMGEGVTVASVEKIKADGKMGMKTIFKFADINKLNYAAEGAMGSADAPGEEAKKDDDATTFKLVDGTLTIIQKQPKADANAADAEEEEMDPQALAMMQGMMQDMRITTQIKIASGIEQTNATHVDGNVITLADIQMGKILANPEKLKALQSGDFDKIKAAMKGVDGVKFEEKENISVKFK